MDKEPTEVNAAKEVEKSAEVPADHDQSRVQAPGSSKSLGQDEQTAIGQ